MFASITKKNEDIFSRQLHEAFRHAVFSTFHKVCILFFVYIWFINKYNFIRVFILSYDQFCRVWPFLFDFTFFWSIFFLTFFCWDNIFLVNYLRVILAIWNISSILLKHIIFIGWCSILLLLYYVKHECSYSFQTINSIVN